MKPQEQQLLLEEYWQHLVNEDSAGVIKVLCKAPKDPSFVSALGKLHQKYEKEYGLTPSPQARKEGLQELQKLFGTPFDNTTTSIPAITRLPNVISSTGSDLDDSEAPSTAGRVKRTKTTVSRRTSASVKRSNTSATLSENSVKQANAYFKAVLAARIVGELYAEPTFGDIKFQKVLYICEHHAQLSALQSQYFRYAYGPHDNGLFNGVKTKMMENGWFEAFQESERTIFKPLDNPTGYMPAYTSFWSSKEEEIRETIGLFRNMRTRQAEIIATLYAVWNDFLIEKKDFTDGDLVYEARYNWDPRKQGIEDNEWLQNLDWMRKVGLIPIGFGKHTKVHRRRK